MEVYYNEWDEKTAAWLGELGAGHHLPAGHVDTRSIRDVRAADLYRYDQCHFFAGIGGWPLALRWAGLEGVPGIWTGSPPCQPFSVAGKGLAQSDERHLAPVWLDLIRERRPAMLFGEQVADAIGKGWLDDLFDALEREGYACGAAVLPACSVGAPHIRKRLFFGAVRLADRPGDRREQVSTLFGRCDERSRQNGWPPGSTVRSGDFGLAQPTCEQHNRTRTRGASRWAEHPDSCAARRLADSSSPGLEGYAWDGHGSPGWPVAPGSVAAGGGAGWAYPDHGGWDGADWLGCRDGKFRPVEPGTQPLAHGLPARVGRLRGYGNAIVPQVAAAFIEEFMNSVFEILN